MGLNRQKWFCAQIGAREHYAVARALHVDGVLAALYTDFWAGTAVRKFSVQTSSGTFHSLSARFHPGLVDAPVFAWNWRALGWETVLRYCWRQNRSGGNYAGFMEVGRRFAVCVRKALERRVDIEPGSIFFAYDTGALETMEWCRNRGIHCVLNQIDPGRVEIDLVRQEERRWPGWQTQKSEVPEEYFRRREKEWDIANRVLVNSEFCRLALMKQGVPADKLVVVPLCYELEGQKPETESQISQKSKKPLRVLWLGQVILRKGIQYLLEAARLLEKEKIQFDVVGPVEISEAAVASAPQNVTFHGRAMRSQTGWWYRQADLFVLPTLSDGFAITQLEAMAHGLPVVTTDCCGAVVDDGLDGFIVPSRDGATLAKTLERYLTEPELAWRQRSAALAKAGQFTLSRLSGNLRSLEEGFC
jgi:glycosyltransferase involved in cell wall biosynthesis